MDWLKARWKERSSQNGVALIAMGVVALVFKPLLGDKVEVEMSPYDMEKGRIIHRHK